jgi:hypothetical protein
MSETLFDYQTRLREEEHLYLLRAIAEKLGVAPFPGVAEPAAQTPPLRVVEVEAPEPAEDATMDVSTRSDRYAWSKLDTRCGELTDLRTYWFNRAAATKDKKAADRAREEYVKVRRQYGRRANALYRLLAQGKIKVEDGVLYDMRNDEPNTVWLAGDFVTK